MFIKVSRTQISTKCLGIVRTIAVFPSNLRTKYIDEKYFFLTNFIYALKLVFFFSLFLAECLKLQNFQDKSIPTTITLHGSLWGFILMFENIIMRKLLSVCYFPSPFTALLVVIQKPNHDS